METPTSGKSSPPVEVVLLLTFEFKLFWSSVYEGRGLMLPSPKKQLQHDLFKKNGHMYRPMCWMHDFKSKIALS